MRATVLLLFAMIGQGMAAQNAYEFERLFTVYTPISGANDCSFNNDGLCPIDALAGETFTLYGLPFTMASGAAISIGEYGFLRIEDESSLIILDGLFTFMEPIDSTSKVLYALNGVSGAHVLVAEWRNWRLTNGPDGNFVNFQLMLDQATGVAEVRFGPNSGGGVLYNNVNGPNCGIFHAPHSFSQCYGKLWAEGNGDAPTLDSLPNFSFDALVSLPSSNTLYRFTPRSMQSSIDEADAAHAFTYSIGADALQVQFLDRNGAQLELVDPAGRIVRSVAPQNGQTSIPIGDLPSGVYILRSEKYSVAVPLRL